MSKLLLPALPRSSMFGSIEEPMNLAWQNFFRDLLTRVGGYDALTNLEIAGSGPPTELTINDGVVIVHGYNKWRFHSIDTEGDAISDNLDTITGGRVGNIILLQAANDSRTVICKNGANLKLQFDFSLNNVEDKLMLICISPGIWHEVARASNGG